jgi:hypothetical protein
VLEGGGWITPCSGCFNPGKETWYPLYRRLDRPQGQSEWVEKISPPTRIRPPGHSAHGQSLYRLRYPSPLVSYGTRKNISYILEFTKTETLNWGFTVQCVKNPPKLWYISYVQYGSPLEGLRFEDLIAMLIYIQVYWVMMSCYQHCRQACSFHLHNSPWCYVKAELYCHQQISQINKKICSP